MTEKRLPIIWMMGVARVRRERLSLAYCGYGKGFAFAAKYEDIITPMAVTDVIIDEDTGYCSDQRWCLNLKCPLNRAMPEKMKHYRVRNMDDVRRLHERLEAAKEGLVRAGFNIDKVASEAPVPPPVLNFREPIINM